jgi:hypothetical protein
MILSPGAKIDVHLISKVLRRGGGGAAAPDLKLLLNTVELAPLAYPMLGRADAALSLPSAAAAPIAASVAV